MPPQTPGVGLRYVIDPALYGRVELAEADFSGHHLLVTMPERARGVPHLASLCAQVIGVYNHAKPGKAGGAGLNLGTVLVQPQPQRRQPRDDGVFGLPQAPKPHPMLLLRLCGWL